jgi:hypothetical protein
MTSFGEALVCTWTALDAPLVGVLFMSCSFGRSVLCSYVSLGVDIVTPAQKVPSRKYESSRSPDSTVPK